METQGNLIATNNSTQSVTEKKDDDQFAILPKARLHRRYFPKDFLFGTASSAYQFEGAAHEGGRGPSIWDTFTQRYPGKIKDGSNGNVAVDSYHLYKEDIKIMKKLGVNAYRFSISWPRVLPGGKLTGGVNKEGIKYYNDLIDELLANGIEPHVTIFHWDLPQCLEDEYQGFLSHKIVDDFRDCAELCFWEFGDRVKKWATINEPTTYIISGYIRGNFPPCQTNDPGREPYWVAHYFLLAHAAAVTLYREKYQSTQKGMIGFVLATMWAEPSNPKYVGDFEAALRCLDFGIGWFVEPITTGQYPASMIKNVGNRLPTFTPTESKQLSGSCDFVGINYYTAKYITNASSPNPECPSYITDGHFSYESTPIGPKHGSAWINVYPIGLYKLLTYIQKTYNDPLLYVTENGLDQPNDHITVTDARKDKWRTEYLQDHLLYIQLALEVGVKVKGYFPWSLLDNFEWDSGYTARFGIIHIDYNNGLARYPKESALWYMNFLHYAPTKRQIEESDEIDQGPLKKLKM